MNLQKLVDLVSESLTPMAVSRGSLLINEVPDNIGMETRADLLAHLIGEVLRVLIRHNDNDCYWLSGKSFSNVVLLHIRGHIRRDSPTLMLCLERLEPLAENLGGCISIQEQENGRSCVSVSFLRNYRTGVQPMLSKAS